MKKPYLTLGLCFSLSLLTLLLAFSVPSFADDPVPGLPSGGPASPGEGGVSQPEDAGHPIACPISVLLGPLSARSNTLAWYKLGTNPGNEQFCSAMMESPSSPGQGDSITMYISKSLAPDYYLANLYWFFRRIGCDLLDYAADRKDRVTIHYRSTNAPIQEIKIISIGGGDSAGTDVGLQGKSKGDSVSARGRVTQFSINVDEGGSCRALIDTAQGNFYAIVQPDSDDCMSSGARILELCNELRDAYQEKPIHLEGVVSTAANQNPQPYAEVIVASISEPVMPSTPKKVGPVKGIKFIP